MYYNISGEEEKLKRKKKKEVVGKQLYKGKIDSTNVCLFNACVYACACMCLLDTHRSLHMGDRGQFAGVNSLLLPCGSQGLNSYQQVWWQVDKYLSLLSHLSSPLPQLVFVVCLVIFASLRSSGWPGTH